MQQQKKKERNRNKIIPNTIKVAPIEDKVWETQLRQFSYARRRSMETPAKRMDRTNKVLTKRGRGRPPKKLSRYDMSYKSIIEDMAIDRND